jgi:hypothetical protein
VADPTTSVAEQIIAIVTTLLSTGRPGGIPELERDRVFDLEHPDLPAMLLTAYEERLSRAQEAGVDQDPDDGSEERALVLGFELYAQAGPGLTATQATDAMAVWIVQRLCGEVGSTSVFFGLADRIRPGARISQLAKAAPPFCATGLEIIVSTSYLTHDLTRRG